MNTARKLLKNIKALDYLHISNINCKFAVEI